MFETGNFRGPVNTEATIIIFEASIPFVQILWIRIFSIFPIENVIDRAFR